MLMAAGPMCTPLTEPGARGEVEVNYMTPAVDPVSRAVILVVGDVVRPTVDITVGSAPAPRARFSIRSLSNRTDVVAIDSGKVLNVIGRGADTLIISVTGVSIDPTLANRTADTVAIIAKPASNVINGARSTMPSLGDTLHLWAVSKARDGSAVAGPSVVWTSSDPGIATVDSITGGTRDSLRAVVTAIAPGTTTITALFEGVEPVTRTITVDQVVDGYSFAVRPAGGATGPTVTQASLSSKNDTIFVVPTARDSRGNAIQVNPPTPVFTTNASPSILALDPNSGRVVGLENSPPGLFVKVVGFPQDSLTIVVKQVATSIAISGPRTVNIAAPTLETTLQAVAKDARGNDLPPNDTKWSSLNQTVAIIDENTGKITTFTPGNSQIGVRRDGARDSVNLVVGDDPRTLTLAPKPLSIPSVNGTAQASYRTFNAASTEVFNRPVTWSSLDPAIATVSTSGLVTGVAVGTTRIAATTTAGGATDTLVVNVTNNPTVVRIDVPTVTIASIGDTLLNVPVTFRNSLGATLPRNSATWQSLDVNVARTTLDGQGNIVAAAKGETQVIARNADNTAADTVGVIVTNAPASVVMNRTSDALSALSLTLQYSADVFNGRGALISGAQLSSEPVTWRSTNGAVASVNTAGLADRPFRRNDPDHRRDWRQHHRTSRRHRHADGQQQRRRNVGQPVGREHHLGRVEAPALRIGDQQRRWRRRRTDVQLVHVRRFRRDRHIDR